MLLITYSYQRYVLTQEGLLGTATLHLNANTNSTTVIAKIKEIRGAASPK